MLFRSRFFAAAAVQEGPPERQITLVIYGEDRCPE